MQEACCTAEAGLKGNAKTVAEIWAYSKRLGLLQKALAQRANVSRSALKYWERKAQIDPKCWAVRRMAKALGIRGLNVFPPNNARARGRGVTGWDQMSALLDAEVELKMTAWRQRATLRAARLRVVCGAKTRKDTPCRNLSEPGRKRCKFHGGKSTGPRRAKEGPRLPRRSAIGGRSGGRANRCSEATVASLHGGSDLEEGQAAFSEYKKQLGAFVSPYSARCYGTFCGHGNAP